MLLSAEWDLKRLNGSSAAARVTPSTVRVRVCARVQPSDGPVEQYFRASMLQDPWAGLRPVAVADRGAPP